MNVRDPERGFVLLIVLWTVAILAVAMSALFSAAHIETQLVAADRGTAVASAAADAAIAAAVLELSRTDGVVPSRQRVGAAIVTVRLDDRSGRINPNLVSADVLRALLLEIGDEPRHAEALAVAIIDWRSPGTRPSPHGAKADQYRAAGLMYGPPGRPFGHLDELGAVLGMTPALLRALAPHLTLWSIDDPDPARSDAIVLAALRDAGMPLVTPHAGETRVIAITAVAGVPEAPRVTRRAVVRFGASPDGRVWRILTWDDGGAGDE